MRSNCPSCGSPITINDRSHSATFEAELATLRRERDEARDLLDSNVSALGRQLSELGRRLEVVVSSADNVLWNLNQGSRPDIDEWKRVWTNLRRAAAVAEAGGEE